MPKTTFLMLSATVMVGAALLTPGAALAQFGPPPGPPPVFAGPPAFAGPPPGFAPGGPPPGLGAGGPRPGGAPHTPLAGLAPRDLAGAPPRDIAGARPHFSRLGGAAELQNLDRRGRTNFRGVEGRGAAYGANYTRGGYAGYGNGHVRGYRHLPYAAAAAAYADSGSYASSDDGCYYVSGYRQNGHRRVLVCPED